MAFPSGSFSINYEVFISFRGLDTRHGFTGHLHKALNDRGIYAFRDDEELQKGEEITPAIVKAIQESKIAIIVLSENYAASSFCLDELVTILECAKRKDLFILPVFYKLEPTDVRHQKGSYGEALAKHEKRFQHSPQRLRKWISAIDQVTYLSGYHFNGEEYEYQFIKRIVDLVSSMINRASLHVEDFPVRLNSPSDAFSYDVFLSFSSVDTRHSFTGHLHKALNDRGIDAVLDYEKLQKGEEIQPATVKAIQESKIAIIVLSENYAASSFCLDELATILECAKRKGLFILPVFYNVEPTDVRHQKGSYGEALAEHEKRLKHNLEKLKKWEKALRQVANLSGFYVKHGDGYEYECIGEILEWVSSRISSAHYPGGLGSQVLEVKKLLDFVSDENIYGVHIIGIHGIDGVGKSTLAREVYNNLIADHFDASCFIENVREKSKKHGVKHLQIILLSNILGMKDVNLTSVQQGISMIQRRLQRKKVLLILDDVDKDEQLQAVVGKPDWFGPGSRVIITTQDKQLLASHHINRTYEVKELNRNESLLLLTWKAFKTEYYDPRYEQLLNRVVDYAFGLPLALEIIGSNLFGKSVEEWVNAIHQLEKSHDNPIQVIFKASFDALEEKERSVFLDIACCFKGYEVAEVQNILHAHYGECVKDHIDVLVDKSLVKLSYATKPCYNRVTLHDLIEDMGKEIDRQESLTKPGERRRLWLPEDIREVLGNDKGTNKIEIICLDLPIFDEEVVEWDGKAFRNMQNLKTLIIKNGNFSQGPEYLPNSLRVLEWWRYPSHCLPSDFHPKDLVICKLPDSHISKVELTDLLKASLIKHVNVRVLNFSRATV